MILCPPSPLCVHPLNKGPQPFFALNHSLLSRTAALHKPWWTGSKLLTYHVRFFHEIQFSIVRSYFLFAIQFFVQPNRLLHYFYIFQFRSYGVSLKKYLKNPTMLDVTARRGTTDDKCGDPRPHSSS